jgi:hypothetical protein
LLILRGSVDCFSSFLESSLTFLLLGFFFFFIEGLDLDDEEELELELELDEELRFFLLA